MIEIAEKISFWVMYSIGLFISIAGLFWALDWVLTWIIKSTGLYADIIDFLRQKRRKKMRERVSRK